MEVSSRTIRRRYSGLSDITLACFNKPIFRLLCRKLGSLHTGVSKTVSSILETGKLDDMSCAFFLILRSAKEIAKLTRPTYNDAVFEFSLMNWTAFPFFSYIFFRILSRLEIVRFSFSISLTNCKLNACQPIVQTNIQHKWNKIIYFAISRYSINWSSLEIGTMSRQSFSFVGWSVALTSVCQLEQCENHFYDMYSIVELR